MNKDIHAPRGADSVYIEVNGRRVHYLKTGEGRPVVLVHGGASSAQEWLPIMTRYCGRFSFYAPDLPGFGQSDRDEKGYYLTDFSDFLHGFIELTGLEKPALAGHSLGGRVCLDTVTRHENDISRLILIDTSGLGRMSPFGNVLFYSFKWMRAFLRKPQPFPTFLAREGDDWDNVSEEALKSIKVPTLLIWKRTDPYLSVSQARRAERLIPNAKLVIIDGYGHAPHQQNDNSMFCSLMLEFLEKEDRTV